MRLRDYGRWAVIASLATCPFFGGAALASPPKAKTPLVIAHRGGAALFPENTFPAFDHAVRLGADMLEFDMEMTADDQLIISHDGTVNTSFCRADAGAPVTGGAIRNLKLVDILKFDCGSSHRDIYPRQTAVPGARMPTPDAFFARYRDTKALFFGEAKMPGQDEGQVDPVAFTALIAAVVRKYRLEDRFVLQSSDYRTIDAMHAIAPRIRTCLLRPWEAKTDYLTLARQHHASCMLLRLENATTAQIRKLHRAGIMIISEVVDDPSSWKAYIERGDDAVFTNDPATLIAFLRSRTAVAR